MSQRINHSQQSPRQFQGLLAFSEAVDGASIEKSLLDLVSIRASQLNGCAFCLDMHAKDARMNGERELRLHHLPTWRESPLFSPREQAALAWTEILTHLPAEPVSDELYERVRGQFSETELSDLTYGVAAINAWNRLNIAFRTTPGSLDAVLGLTKANLD